MIIYKSVVYIKKVYLFKIYGLKNIVNLLLNHKPIVIKRYTGVYAKRHKGKNLFALLLIGYKAQPKKNNSFHK